MKWPFVWRKEHEEVLARLADIERHFVTKRDEQGRVIETLADRHRNGVKPPKRVTMKQLCKWLEQTDGGRKLSNGEQSRTH